MEDNKIKGAVGVGVTVALVVGLLVSTGAAGVLAAHTPAVGDAQNQMGNSTNTSANTTSASNAPSPATMGTLNNSTMASMSNDELATRALELQRVLGPTQTQYLKQIRALELQLNAAQQGNNSSATTGVLPSANQSMANATLQGQTEGVAPLNNSTLNGMSHDQLTAQILQLQQVTNQTQTQYLKQIRTLELQLNNAQNQSQEGGQVSPPAPAPSNQTTQNATNAGHGGNGKAKTGNGKAKAGSGNQMG